MAELYKRGGSPYFYARLSDPRQPDGFTRRSTKCSRRGEAREVAGALQAEIDEEIRNAAVVSRDACGLTWVDAMLDFVERATHLKPSTRRGYAKAGVVVTQTLGDFDLGLLTHDDLKQFCHDRREMLVAAPGAAPTGKKVCDQTIRNNLSMMSSVYSWIIDSPRLDKPQQNPLASFDRSNLRASRRVDRHLRSNQFGDALECLRSAQHKAMLIVLVGTGMRMSELLHLRWSEVDVLTNYVEFGNLDLERTKSSRSRRIPFDNTVKSTLLAHREWQLARGLFDRNGLVFPSPRHPGEPRANLDFLKEAVQKRTGMKSFRIHGLRHTFASWKLQRGADPDAIRRVLGHTSFSTTSLYAHHIDDSAAAALRSAGLPWPAQNEAHSSGLCAVTETDEGNNEAETTA